MKNKPSFFIILVLIVINFPFSLLCQIKGKVYNIETNEPIEGVHVKSKANTESTNIEGTFSINDKGWIKFIHVSYEPDSVYIDNIKNNLNVLLTPKLININDIVIDGLLHKSKLKTSTISLSILRRKDLELLASLNYLEKLNQLSGVFIHTGTLNTNRITIRGIGSRNPYGTNRVKAYYNDISLTSADGTTNIEDIDKSLINQVDVYKGPKSAIYGSGLGGIILLSDQNYYKENFSGKVSFETGSYQSYKPSININYKRNNWLIGIFYSNTKSEGFRENSSYNKHSAQLKTEYNTKRNKTSFIFHYIDLKAHIPSSINIDDFNTSPEKAANNWLAIKGFEEYKKIITGISNEFRFSDKLKNKTTIYANLSDAYESRPFNILDDKNKRIGIRSFFHFDLKNFQVKVGGEYVDEQYDWEIYETDNGTQGILLNNYSEKRKQASLFADLLMTIDKFKIETGISYNYQAYNLKDLYPSPTNHSGNYQYKNIPAPFIGANFQLNKSLNIYISYSYGFSYPTVEETLLPDGQINNNLKPETGNCFDLGLRLSLLNGNLFFNAGAYIMFIENLLLTERITEDIFTGKNAGKTRHSGIEFSTNVSINQQERLYLPKTSISISGEINNHVFLDFVDDGVDLKENILPGVPEYTLNSSLKFQYSKGVFLEIAHQIIGKQFLNDENSATYHANNLLHSKIGFKYRLKSKNILKVFFSANNIANKNYAPMLLVNAPSFGSSLPRYYYSGNPRNYYLGINFEF